MTPYYRLKIAFLLVAFSSCSLSFAQETASQAPVQKTQAPTKPQGSLSSGTIANQFNYLNSISNNYQEYKVVRKTNLDKLQQNIADSLKSIQAKLIDANAILNGHDKEVVSLKDSLNSVLLQLKNTREQKESQNFLGIQLSKGTYNTIIWSIISLLLASLIFYVYRFKQSHILTSEAQKTLEEIKNEFEQHRKKSMEREQKLNRRLQDELNKRL